MPNERQSVEDVFEEALSLSYDERVVLLNKRCHGAPEFRRAVELLLDANDQAGSFLDRPLLAPRSENTPSTAQQGSAGDNAGGDGSSPLRMGMIIAGRFTIHRFIARGGMGEVWEAWDSQVQERVAIKTIRPDLAFHSEAVERFRLEVKQARAISHPNVCRIHELFTFEAKPGTKVMFLCMEFLDGPSLSDYLRHNGPFAPDAALKLVRQLILGLNSAHLQGVVHRDFKSKNIMLVNSGPGKLRAVITDFGLAMNVLTPTGHLQERKGQGTPDYMAPEQRLMGNVTSSADQYALGVVMCEMITGSRPVSAEGRPSRGKVAVQLPEGQIPARWSGVLHRCLAARPEDRFSSLDEIIKCLDPPKRFHWQRAAVLASTACLVILAVVGWARYAASPVQATSLAVLPLLNTSGDRQLDYLGVGLTEALTNDLAVMPGLQVKAEGIAARYSAQTADPGELGKRLKVSFVVSGSFLNLAGRLSIPVEMIDVDTGSQIWGKTYEGDISNLAELQNEISTDAAYHLKIRLDPDLQARLKRQYSTVPAAYDAYLKGRYRLTLRVPEELRLAVMDFQRALGADPRYAPAYAGLADSYVLLADYGYAHQIPMMTNALKAANQALALDSTLGEAYASRAFARTGLNYEWKQAESDYTRALGLNPSYMNAHIWYALTLLVPLGRDAEAEAQLNYAGASDPDSLLTNTGLAMAAYCSKREAQSASILEGHFENLKHFEPAIDLLASDYLALKRTNDALALLQNTAVQPGEQNQRAMMFSIAYARAGNNPEAARWFRSATQKEEQDISLSYATARYYNSLGDQNRALDSLELAYLKRDPDLLYVSVDPLLTTLHPAPRFKKLLTRMNLQ